METTVSVRGLTYLGLYGEHSKDNGRRVQKAISRLGNGEENGKCYTTGDCTWTLVILIHEL